MTKTTCTIGANQLLQFLDIGMYETHLVDIYDTRIEQELEYLNEEHKIHHSFLPKGYIVPPVVTYDDLDGDKLSQEFTRFQALVISTSQYIAKDFCNDFYNLTDCKISFDVDSINSPREYNFATDVLNANLNISNLSKLQKYCINYYKDNSGLVSTIIKERFASGSGFWSFYSDSIIEHIAEVKEGNLDYILIAIDLIASQNLDYSEYQDDLINYIQDNFNIDIDLLKTTENLQTQN
jgi:hypothetical protein